MKTRIYLLAVVLSVGGSTFVTAASEEKGKRIALAMDRVESGYGDYRAEVEMTLRDRKGRESVRQLRFRTKDGDKSMIVFDQPRDIKGVTALTYAHKTSPYDQWLYLPKLRRVKRISSANQADPFVGSKFAYLKISAHRNWRNIHIAT